MSNFTICFKEIKAKTLMHFKESVFISLFSQAQPVHRVWIMFPFVVN